MYNYNLGRSRRIAADLKNLAFHLLVNNSKRTHSFKTLIEKYPEIANEPEAEILSASNYGTDEEIEELINKSNQ